MLFTLRPRLTIWYKPTIHLSPFTSQPKEFNLFFIFFISVLETHKLSISQSLKLQKENNLASRYFQPNSQYVCYCQIDTKLKEGTNMHVKGQHSSCCRWESFPGKQNTRSKKSNVSHLLTIDNTFFWKLKKYYIINFMLPWK